MKLFDKQAMNVPDNIPAELLKLHVCIRELTPDYCNINGVYVISDSESIVGVHMVVALTNHLQDRIKLKSIDDLDDKFKNGIFAVWGDRATQEVPEIDYGTDE